MYKKVSGGFFVGCSCFCLGFGFCMKREGFKLGVVRLEVVRFGVVGLGVGYVI